MIYFDNAATTYPKPECVYQAMDDCARNYAVNVGRGQYSLSDTATFIVEDTRRKLLNFFNAKKANIIFTPSATIALNQVINGQNFSKIKNVYISPFEHNAVIRTINYLKKIYDFELHYIALEKNPFLYDLDNISKQFIQNPPDLVILSHASNVCGAVIPAEYIFKLSKIYQAINILDTAQTAGIIKIEYDAWYIDYLVFAGHKGLLGPLGVAGFISKNSGIKLLPLLKGGTGYDSINPYMPEEFPSKFEAGSLNINAIAGLNAALEFFNSYEYKIKKDNDYNILNTFEEILSEYDDELTILGSNYQGNRVPVISVIHEYYAPDELGLILNNHNIAVRTGLHCAPNTHKFFSTLPAGAVRFSFGIFNKLEELGLISTIMEDL